MHITIRLAQVRVQQENLATALEQAQQCEKQMLQQYAEETRLFADGYACQHRGRPAIIKSASCQYGGEDKSTLLISYVLTTPTGEALTTIREEVLTQEREQHNPPEIAPKSSPAPVLAVAAEPV